MADHNESNSSTVPDQPESKPPLRKSLPIVVVLIVIVALIGIANISSLLTGNKKAAPPSTLTVSPTTPNAQQVSSFESQQQAQARHDAEERQRQQELAAAMQQLQQDGGVPGPEAGNAPPMTAAQRAAIYGESPNAPQHTSNMSEAQAEAKQRRLALEKQKADALNSDTVALDFSHEGMQAQAIAASAARSGGDESVSVQETAGKQTSRDAVLATVAKNDPMATYSFDQFQGQLYRVFEGTVLEGVVTNHVDGGLAGPILVMLTTDYYSHDHQQLLMPQGTRLIGSVQSVGNEQQRKMFVTFHRAVCPDGFSLDFDKYLGLDQIGTTGLATKVDHGYLLAFGAAAAIGGLGGLAQIGNNGSVFTPSTQIRNGISEQSAQEGEQVLNRFLNRLPIITLKEGSQSLASQLMASDNQMHLVSQVSSGQVESGDVQVRNVTITSMSEETVQGARVARGTALLTVDKLYSEETSHQPRTEHWLFSVTYYLNPKQVSDQAKIYPQYEFINPLGLTITEFHENRVSVDLLQPGTTAPNPNAIVQSISRPPQGVAR